MNDHDTCHHRRRETQWRDRQRAAHTGWVTRRRALAGGLGAVAGLAGCLDGGSGDEDVPEPVALSDTAQCDVCGMVVVAHPGPIAEVFYADQQPSGHDNPARFDSAWEAFQYDFERQDRGWERQAFYVTDYSAVSYDVFEDGGDRLITSHADVEAFGDATELTFVAGSSVLGAMGRDLIGFSSGEDATSFQSAYGGDVYSFEEVTPAVVAQLGRG